MKIKKGDFVKAKVHTSVTPGQAIKIVRKLQGLSQNALSVITGISQSNLSALENGSRQLGRENSIRLAKALNEVLAQSRFFRGESSKHCFLLPV